MPESTGAVESNIGVVALNAHDLPGCKVFPGKSKSDIINILAPVAQWIEQETSKLLAVGSIPTRGTMVRCLVLK